MPKSAICRGRRIVLAAGAFWAAASAAVAAPVTYTLSGVANGSLGAMSFVDAPFVVTAVGDTATVNSPGLGVPCIDPKSATFAIRGIGSGAITTPISVADNQDWQLVAFARGRCLETGPMWTNGRNPELDAYDLARNLGPVPLTLPSAPPGISIETSAGPLVLRSVTGLTFQAQVSTPTVVPSLTRGALSLLALALAGTGAVAARRRQPR